ncbi:hypothetical protein [Acinetobacter baumannii]|uniref:hypothetical protein n=1 Tax=Acinetobacter baumannii TaxID=470 RepID=UPI00396CC709
MMSNKIVNEIRRLPIESTPKMLLWVISDIADDDGNTSWYAPRSRLMEETGYSRTTIASCLSYLKECGILNITGGNGRLNQYLVTPQNFNPSVKYEPKKQSKPVSEVDQSAKQTSQLGGPHQSATLTTPVNLATKPVSEVDQSAKQTSQLGGPHQSATLTTPVNLATKPVSEVDTIHHSIIYPSVNPSLGDSENAPKAKTEHKVKRITKKQAGINRLVELGCEEKYAHDWMVARKGAELTDSVIENLTEQAHKANITLAMAVQWSAKKGYQGFKADWYLKDQQPQQVRNANYQSSHQQTISEQAKWDNFLNRGTNFRDVTPKKSLLIEGVGHA